MKMNREIKFRAFCKDTSKMLYLPDIYFTSNGREFQVVDRNTQFVVENKFVMQYTGAKDSQGVEIFEGDILEFTDIRDDKTYSGEVYFANGGFHIKADEDYTPHLSNSELAYVTKVSNIHELIGENQSHEQ